MTYVRIGVPVVGLVQVAVPGVANDCTLTFSARPNVEFRVAKLQSATFAAEPVELHFTVLAAAWASIAFVMPLAGVASVIEPDVVIGEPVTLIDPSAFVMATEVTVPDPPAD